MTQPCSCGRTTLRWKVAFGFLAFGAFTDVLIDGAAHHAYWAAFHSGAFVIIALAFAAQFIKEDN